MKRESPRLNFPRVPIAEAALHRGKHAKTVANILSDLATLDEYSAIKIDLAQVGQKKLTCGLRCIAPLKRKR